jgi:cell division protein FtsI (penicillin-binding protein 3)
VVVRRVRTATGEVVREAAPRVRRRAVPAHVARTVAEMMIAVTEGHGTGVEAAIEGYQVAGKTATAQKTDPRTGRYSLDKYIASFVGFLPARKPVVAIAVTLDEPMIDHAGGSVAAPVFRRITQRALEYYGLTPKGTRRVDLRELARKPDPAHVAHDVWRRAQGEGPRIQEHRREDGAERGRVKMPDMTGWPVRRVVVQLTELGLEPKVSGTGLLARQVPAPGQLVQEGAPVLLVFEPAT